MGKTAHSPLNVWAEKWAKHLQEKKRQYVTAEPQSGDVIDEFLTRRTCSGLAI